MLRKLEHYQCDKQRGGKACAAWDSDDYGSNIGNLLDVINFVKGAKKNCIPRREAATVMTFVNPARPYGCVHPACIGWNFSYHGHGTTPPEPRKGKNDEGNPSISTMLLTTQR
jgi:hypothetical protein